MDIFGADEDDEPFNTKELAKVLFEMQMKAHGYGRTTDEKRLKTVKYCIENKMSEQFAN